MSQNPQPYRTGLVSVVTPVYNGEAHLPGMLESVLGQTYPEVEMILVDDGSTDATLQVAEGYRDRFAARGYGYRVVRGEHRNASAAINRGLPFVSGEFLIWPDSDDYLTPRSVARRVEFLRQNPGYACVRSLPYYFDAATGERSGRADEQRGDLKREDLFWDILEGRTFVCCGCYMLRAREFFQIYPRRRIPEYGVGQNFQMLLPMMYRHKCPTLEEELYGVALREGSHSRTALSREQEKKKYGDYEALVDEIAQICAMDSREELERVQRWKAERRYQLALKHRRWGEAFRALAWLGRCGGLRPKKALDGLLWAVFREGRVGKGLSRLYRRFFHER